MSEVLLIGFDDSHGEDVCVLTVGRRNPKMATGVEIINVIKGDEAKFLYSTLTTKEKESKTNE